MRPAWVPWLDGSRYAQSKPLDGNDFARFERSVFYAARVRNVSSVGSQTFSRSFPCAVRQRHPSARNSANAKDFAPSGSLCFGRCPTWATNRAPLPHHRRAFLTVSAPILCTWLAAAHDRPTPSRTSSTPPAYIVNETCQTAHPAGSSRLGNSSGG